MTTTHFSRRPACSSSGRGSRSRPWPSSTAEALRSAEASPPDVILVDISLGEESGLDLARRLAEADGGREGTTVILISTHTQADFADVIAESSAAGFLPKAELSAAAIRRIVEGGSS
jgi:DNA-binding NarL/FixJ family response regulator